MRVEPKTEQEVQEMNLLPAGVYDFLISEAEDKQSQKGNDMAVIKLKIDGDEGRTHTIVDYLVSIESMAYKLRHFAESVGLLEQYEKGDMPAEFMQGRTGKCKLVIQPAKGEYRAKNTVADYIKSDGAAQPVANFDRADLDDEIPF